jgi:hypothetical protein
MENIRKKDSVLYHSNDVGTRLLSWLEDSAASRDFAASTPDVIGMFYLINPLGHTVTLISTQLLTEMSADSSPGMRRDDSLATSMCRFA